MECQAEHILRLLCAVLPHLLHVTRVLSRKGVQDAKARHSAEEHRGSKKHDGVKKPPGARTQRFYLSLQANLCLLLKVANTRVEQMHKLRGTMLQDTHAFLEVVVNDDVSVRRSSSRDPVSYACGTGLQDY